MKAIAGRGARCLRVGVHGIVGCGADAAGRADDQRASTNSTTEEWTTRRQQGHLHAASVRRPRLACAGTHRHHDAAAAGSALHQGDANRRDRATGSRTAGACTTGERAGTLAPARCTPKNSYSMARKRGDHDSTDDDNISAPDGADRMLRDARHRLRRQRDEDVEPHGPERHRAVGSLGPERPERLDASSIKRRACLRYSA